MRVTVNPSGWRPSSPANEQGLENGLVIAVTETATSEDIEALEVALKEVCQ